MRLAVNGASVHNLPGSGVDANMFAREIVYACVLFSHVLAVQIPSLELGALCEIVGSRHDLSTRSTLFRSSESNVRVLVQGKRKAFADAWLQQDSTFKGQGTKVYCWMEKQKLDSP